MSCQYAKSNGEGRNNCEVSGDECIYLIPNEKQCKVDGFIDEED